MKNGLAIWHYPHRSVLENVDYFAECGFESVSLHGKDMLALCEDKEAGNRLAELIKTKNLVLTAHHILPRSHSEENINLYKHFIDTVAVWQKEHGCLAVLSFDVPQAIRDNITPYIDYALNTVEESKIAVEDFGLNPTEKAQIEHLKGNCRFGYLLDIGHMYIRIRGKNQRGITLFSHSDDEGAINENPTTEDFLTAFKSKEFPIFEIHLHNNDGENDLHYFLEDGTLEIATVAKLIKKIGFDGVLTIESAPGFKFECKYPESDIRINKTFDYWKKLYAQS